MADTSAREFIVTREFIHKYKTANGGWTRAQTDVLGISWPLQPGWMRSAIGRKLTDEQVEQMILESFEYAESDIEARLVIEARNEAETVLNATAKGLDDERINKGPSPRPCPTFIHQFGEPDLAPASPWIVHGSHHDERIVE